MSNRVFLFFSFTCAVRNLLIRSFLFLFKPSNYFYQIVTKKLEKEMKIYEFIFILFAASTLLLVNAREETASKDIVVKEIKETPKKPQSSAEEATLLPLMKSIVRDPEFLSFSYADQLGILLAINDIFENRFVKNEN